MKAKKFNTWEESDMSPGSYVLFLEQPDYPIFLTLPCGHNFRPDKRWGLYDLEDEQKITITPSIFCSPQVPCWHGYLTKGVFITV